MSKTLIVFGYGPGISKAVAERFGREGYAVALGARSAERLAAGVKALEAQGVKAAAVAGDLGKAEGVAALVAQARKALGPIAAIHWNAYAQAAGDLTTADPAALRAALEVPVVSLVTAVNAALPDLRETKGAVLVTNGGFAKLLPQVDQIAVTTSNMGLAVANAAKHKAVRVLAERLTADGIYVGEVTVVGSVKGSAWDRGNATVEPAAVADRFWQLASARTERFVDVS